MSATVWWVIVAAAVVMVGVVQPLRQGQTIGIVLMVIGCLVGRARSSSPGRHA